MNINNKSFISNLSITYISHFITILSQIVLIKLLVLYLSESDFGAYMVIKRFISAVWPILTIHLGLSMSRNIGVNRENKTNYLISSVIIITIVFLIYLAITLTFKKISSSYLFGAKKYYHLIFPLGLYLYSNSLKSIISGYFRGGHNFLGMNLVRMLFWAIQVLVIFILYSLSIDRYRLLNLFLVVFSSISITYFMFFILKKIPRYYELIQNNGILGIFRSNYNLIKYGVHRLPNVMLMAAIFFIPVFYASNKLSLKDAGYIGCVITYIRLFQVAGEPFNQILLPVFSFNKTNKGMTLIKKHSRLLLEFIFSLPSILGMIGYFVADEVIVLWFGNNYSSIIDEVSLISPLVMFLFAFILIRGVLNGLFSYPYMNLISLYGLVSIICGIIIVYFYKLGIEGLSITIGVGVSTLGLSSIYYLSKNLDIKVFSKKNIMSIFWAITVLFLFYIFKKIIIIENIYLMIFIKLLFSLLMLLISIIIYIKNNYNWTDMLIQKYNLNKISLIQSLSQK